MASSFSSLAPNGCQMLPRVPALSTHCRSAKAAHSLARTLGSLPCAWCPCYGHCPAPSAAGGRRFVSSTPSSSILGSCSRPLSPSEAEQSRRPAVNQTLRISPGGGKDRMVTMEGKPSASGVPEKGPFPDDTRNRAEAPPYGCACSLLLRLNPYRAIFGTVLINRMESF